MFTAIVFLPLLGAIIAGFFGRAIGASASQFITSSFLVISAILSCIAFGQGAGQEAQVIQVLTWMESGTFAVDWSLRIDALTRVMLVVVTVVSSIVHIYSIGYMSHDPHRQRFFAYLSLFTFAMLMLVTSNNFVQLFFGWEGVGLASYLLIGFWYKKPSANSAAIKAFVVNRVGDFGFALGIFATYFVFDTVDFTAVFQAVPSKADDTFMFLGFEVHIMTTICLLLFMGAMGKSAQFLLHTWLPDAMEGPTPVSALIHAATMVTAGVFLVCRASPMFEYAPDALAVVTVVGATTAFFAATIGLFQNDIKRVIAYSTCSQLGYMFFAAGVSAYGAAMFHLFTHAFFKALLFLCAGSVIHAMSDEQDMRKMGGLVTLLPYTYAFMLVGTIALIGFGIPFTPIGFAGFASKDAVIELAYAAGTNVGMYAFVMGIVAALMTSFYSWRLIFMTFHGTHRSSNEVLKKVHESPSVMLLPLVVLVAGSMATGWFFKDNFIGQTSDRFWSDAIYVADHGGGHGAEKAHPADDGHAATGDDHSVDDHASAAHEGDHTAKVDESNAPLTDGQGAEHAVVADSHDAHADEAHDAHGGGHHGHHPPAWVIVMPVLVTVLGFLIAYYYYIMRPELPAQLAARRNPIYLFVYNKWYFDELYDYIFVNPARWLGRALWKQGDGWLIDGFGPDGISARVLDTTKRAVKLQSGYIYHYAFAMLIGVAALTTWFAARSF